jgi:hypothetical protein
MEEESTWSIDLEADERLGRVTGRPGISGNSVFCQRTVPSTKRLIPIPRQIAQEP